MMTTNALLDSVDQLISSELVPQVNEIDQQGVYPRAFMQKLGRLGGFRAALPAPQGGLGLGIETQVAVISAVGAACGSTAFASWCQTASAWYLSRTQNTATQQRYLAAIANGEALCGTGMSNTVKHLAGIEKMHLKAEKQGDQYVVNGVLPWVSNIGEGHLITTTAQLDDNRYVMFVVACDSEQLSLHPCPAFSGMEGTETYNVRFKNLVVDADSVLAHPKQFFDYIDDIKPGFVLTEAGMGLGVVEGSLKTIRQTNKTHAHVNVFLDDQADQLQAELDELRQQIGELAAQADKSQVELLDVLKARATASELALRAAQSAALHAGARGYLMRHPAQRRLREALFVAIVTPALKHLRREIHAMESAPQKEVANG